MLLKLGAPTVNRNTTWQSPFDPQPSSTNQTRGHCVRPLRSLRVDAVPPRSIPSAECRTIYFPEMNLHVALDGRCELGELQLPGVPVAFLGTPGTSLKVSKIYETTRVLPEAHGKMGLGISILMQTYSEVQGCFITTGVFHELFESPQGTGEGTDDNPTFSAAALSSSSERKMVLG